MYLPEQEVLEHFQVIGSDVRESKMAATHNLYIDLTRGHLNDDDDRVDDTMMTLNPKFKGDYCFIVTYLIIP